MRKEASYISVITAVGLATTALGGGMWLGAIAADVDQLQNEQKTAKEDHDRLITVSNEVKHVKEDVEDIKADVKLILTAVQQFKNEDI